MQPLCLRYRSQQRLCALRMVWGVAFMPKVSLVITLVCDI
jgi:hypothetical protein